MPGGTHWGGGLCINSADHARVGQLILQQGRWQDLQVLPESWCRALATPCEIKPVYGYFWWLNTDHAYHPNAPAGSIFASGAGGNTIWVDQSLDLVMVSRWLNPASLDDVIDLVVQSLG